MELLLKMDILLRGLLDNMQSLMSLKLQLLTVSRQGTEDTARGLGARERSATRGFMLPNFRMARLGR